MLDSSSTERQKSIAYASIIDAAAELDDYEIFKAKFGRVASWEASAHVLLQRLESEDRKCLIRDIPRSGMPLRIEEAWQE